MDYFNPTCPCGGCKNTRKLLDVLDEAALQIEYMHQKFKETGTGNAVLAKIHAIQDEARQ